MTFEQLANLRNDALKVFFAEMEKNKKTRRPRKNFSVSSAHGRIFICRADGACWRVQHTAGDFAFTQISKGVEEC